MLSLTSIKESGSIIYSNLEQLENALVPIYSKFYDNYTDYKF